jgi:hypothetical protein
MGELMSEVAVRMSQNQMAALKQLPDAYEKEGPEGDAIRQRVGGMLMAVDGPQFNSVGMQLGYYYDDSPINVADGSTPPAFVVDRYEPTSRPGSRAPHVWVDEQTALFDRLGPDFTLLKLGSAAPDGSAIEQAAQLRNVPLKVVEIADEAALAAYEGYPLVLVRPDQHVAWRGRGAPADALSVIDRVRGA